VVTWLACWCQWCVRRTGGGGTCTFPHVNGPTASVEIRVKTGVAVDTSSSDQRQRKLADGVARRVAAGNVLALSCGDVGNEGGAVNQRTWMLVQARAKVRDWADGEKSVAIGGKLHRLVRTGNAANIEDKFLEAYVYGEDVEAGGIVYTRPAEKCNENVTAGCKCGRWHWDTFAYEALRKPVIAPDGDNLNTRKKAGKGNFFRPAKDRAGVYILADYAAQLVNDCCEELYIKFDEDTSGGLE
jgi:hypothetical protein